MDQLTAAKLADLGLPVLLGFAALTRSRPTRSVWIDTSAYPARSAASAMTTAWVTKSMPWPPSALETAAVRKPVTVSMCPASAAFLARRPSD